MLHRATHIITLLPAQAQADASLPEWVEIIPAGRFSGRDGRGPYELDADAVLAAFAAGAIDLPVDFEHQTLDAADKAGPVPAAGWIKELQARAGALWARVQWTERAAELIRSREYRYLSPVFRHDKSGRIRALEGAGLTHYPNLHLRAVAHITQKGSSMTELEPVASALGLPAESDAATLAAHAGRLKADLEAAMRAPDPAAWVPMSQHKAVAETLASLQATLAQEQADAAVRVAMAAGRLAPAMKEWAQGYASKDPQGFADWCSKAPVILPPGGAPTAPPAASHSALSDEDRYVCQMLSIPEKDFAAHKQATSKE